MSEADSHGERIENARPFQYRLVAEEARKLADEFELLRRQRLPRAGVVWVPDDVSSEQKAPWTYLSGAVIVEVLQTQLVEGLPPFVDAALHDAGSQFVRQSVHDIRRFCSLLHLPDESEDVTNAWQLLAQIDANLDSTILQRCASLLDAAMRIKWFEIVPDGCWSKRYDAYGNVLSISPVNWFTFVCCLSDYTDIPRVGYSGRSFAAAIRVQDHWQLETWPQQPGKWNTALPRDVVFKKCFNSRPWFKCHWDDFFLASMFACRFLQEQFLPPRQSSSQVSSDIQIESRGPNATTPPLSTIEVADNIQETLPEVVWSVARTISEWQAALSWPPSTWRRRRRQFPDCFDDVPGENAVRIREPELTMWLDTAKSKHAKLG